MTKRQWSLVVVLILVNWIIFSQLFQRIMNTNSTPVAIAVPTTVPTFTPSPVVVQPKVEAPTATLVPVDPTATNTPVLISDEEKAAMAATKTAQAAPTAEDTPTPEPVDTRPMVFASEGAVNLRSGPGTNYDKVGAMQNGQSLEIVGRNDDSSWWQASTVNGFVWVAASVTSSENTDVSIPVVDAPPPPVTPTPAAPPTATPVPQPQYQYTIHNIFNQVNEGITQIRGQITDTAGNPIDSIRVRVRSGSFCTVSIPSGKPGTYPHGNYDVLLDNHAKNGTWMVAIVDGPSNPEVFQCNDGLNVLSEEVTVNTNNKEGVVFVEWTKNY